jgi:tRNA U34 5-methylaminomethyl-2-thiouridine-forming methyltransferase MnmC
MTLQPILTQDGSHTLFVPELNEVYHSRFGAIRESKQVFIEAGLHYFHSPGQLSILEIGFGTGLNAFLTMMEAAGNGLFISYTSLEDYPVDVSVYSLLNYPEISGYSEMRPDFIQLHSSPWNKPVNITPFFALTKVHDRLETFHPEPESHELIYFDAFGPDIQPELWTENIFRKMYETLKPGGILTTYSAKGSVRRAMKTAGFGIEKLPGPPGKREITRGIKPDNA